MLIGKILRSPYSHARILSIDTSRAEKLPGVKAVITGKDTTGRKFGTIKAYKAIWDELPLCIDKVRYIGDEVAAVAAVDEDTALEAIELIDVEYEELPAVFDPQEAMKPGAPVIHAGFEKNVSMQVFLEAGDVEQGFRDSYRVFEDRFETYPVAHSCMEPHSSVGNYSDGKVTLWSSTQAPFVVRMALAHHLDLPEAQVRVLKMAAVGGGFGSKTDLYSLDACCVLLSKKAGRPVKIVLTRQEEFETTRTRHSIIVEIKTGVTKDGVILAKQVKNVLDGGAYTGVGLVAPYLSMVFLTLPYKIPNIKFEATRVYTTKVRGGAMRGYGSPQVIFAADSQMDIIAHELGIDPTELRQRNAITTGYQTANGLKISSSAFPETIDKGSKSIGWQEKRGKMGAENKGVGMGCSGYIVGTGVAGGTPSNYSAGAII
ncbi:MAG: molybdopterin-dependent oxidoreductase, partial [Dehalococcoidia bacterium]|nr:molybdopterin-dependent oxidoreductase [Dehalococcoidia bacterium]